MVANTLTIPTLNTRLHLAEDQTLNIAGADLAHRSRPAFLRSLRGVERFSEIFGQVVLRSYQAAAAKAIVNSVLKGQGLSFVVMFPRQSGKNMLQAQLEVYLMTLLAQRGAEMVKLSPTYQPQSLNAMRRLESALEANWLTHGAWRKSAGNHYRFRNAHLTFLSAAPGSNIVGATASTLLQLDEAQDIEIPKYDKQIAPMAASTNATRVFWGTAWTADTLLARELRLAEEAQARDGLRRVFRLDAEAVRREVPAYGLFVDEQVARLGRTHPMVRSQFFSEEIDFGGGLFTAQRLSLLKGTHSPLDAPRPGAMYAMLVDLAGEDESQRVGGIADAALANPGRDATAITIVEVDTSLQDALLPNRPRYRIVRREHWVGVAHSTQYQRLLALNEKWCPRRLVVDATGVGAGVASFLQERLGEKVIPLRFSSQLKSKLGWGFLAVLDTGRLQDFAAGEPLFETDIHNPLGEAMRDEQERLQALFLRQLAGIKSEVLPGPERLLRWSVPEGTPDPLGGSLHDDLAISAAMVAVLDDYTWPGVAAPEFVQALDPLIEMNGGYR